MGIFERIAVTDANDKALHEAVVQMSFAGVKLDSLEKKQAAEVENQTFVFGPMHREVPIAQIDRIGILVPDKPVIDIGTTPANPS